MKKIFVVMTSFCVALCAGLAPAQADESAVEIQLDGKTVSVVTESGTSLDSGKDISNETVFSSDDYEVEIGKHASDSLQLLIQIDSADAPNSYNFVLPGVIAMEKIPIGADNLYRLVGSDDRTLGWLGNPWAKDAAGKDVSTSYSFQAGVLTQHVNLDEPGIEFPVTADPYLGKSLISSVKATWTNNSYYVLSVAVSSWMWDVYGLYSTLGVWGYSQAYNVAITYGWDETLSKMATKYGMWFRDYIVTKPTFEDQWDCHAFGAPALFAGAITGIDPHPTWDLEGYRPHVQNAATWISTKCSWK